MYNPEHLHFYFLTAILITVAATILIRDKRMINMSLILLITWAISNAINHNIHHDYWRFTNGLLNLFTFAALMVANRGSRWEPNLWAFLAIFFDGLMLPSHLPPLYDWLGPYYHTLWVNICFGAVILILFIGACHRIFLDLYWNLWKYPKMQQQEQETRNRSPSSSGLE